MANLANYAISLGLLIAVLAAILAATRRTPATAGAALPILAAATGRQPTRRTGTGRASTRKGTGNSKGTGNGKANGTGNGKANGNGNGKATRAGNGQTTTATPPRTPRRAKADTTAVPEVNPVSGTERLLPGKLQEQVLAYLADHAGEELSPSQIARALGRSSGAVGNGLESLAKDGEVQKTRQTPRRFMIPARPKAARGNRTGRAATPAAPTPTRATRATRGTRKASTGPKPTSGTTGNGKANGTGNGAKAEPPATPDQTAKAPTATPASRKPTTRHRTGKAGAAADEAAATGT